MKEEQVGTVSNKDCETNPVHEEVTQRLGGGWTGTDSFSLCRDKEHQQESEQ